MKPGEIYEFRGFDMLGHSNIQYYVITKIENNVVSFRVLNRGRLDAQTHTDLRNVLLHYCGKVWPPEKEEK